MTQGLAELVMVGMTGEEGFRFEGKARGVEFQLPAKHHAKKTVTENKGLTT